MQNQHPGQILHLEHHAQLPANNTDTSQRSFTPYTASDDYTQIQKHSRSVILNLFYFNPANRNVLRTFSQNMNKLFQ